MLNELMDLLSRPINDPVVKAFAEKHKIKYPKKETYSQNSDAGIEQSNDKKFNIVFDFKPGRWNPKYPEIPAEKGGTFYYSLGSIRLKDDTELELLKKLKISSKDVKPDELFKILGKRKPTKRGNFTWTVPIDKEKDICASVSYSKRYDEVSANLEIPQRPLFSDFPVQELNEVLGKPVNSPEVKAFIEKYNGVYPKKDTIDASIDPSTVKANVRHQTENQFYTVDIAGGAIGLYFGLKEKNERYYPVPAKKADHFYPILNKISLRSFYKFNYEDNIIHFPMRVKSDDSIETILKKWGKPLRSSEEDGFYCWEVPLNENGDFVLEVFYSIEDGDLQKANEFYGIELNIKLKP